MYQTGEYVYNIEIVRNSKDLELSDTTFLYGLKFFSSSGSINGRLDNTVVQELLKN